MAALALLMRENPDIKRTIDLLESQNNQTQQQEFIFLLNHYETLTNQYNALMEKMNTLNEKVNEINDKKSPLAVMLDHMGNILAGIGKMLKSVTDSIFEFSKNTIDAAKDKSLSAVGAVAGTLHISEGLQIISESLNKAAAKVENLELFHEECAESKLLTKFETPSSLESLSQDELNTLYDKILDIGMNDDLSSGENAFLQVVTEEIESLLPERAEFEQAKDREFELEQGEEL